MRSCGSFSSSLFLRSTNGEVAAAKPLTEGSLPRKKIPRNIGQARKLRKSMTLPEILLWQRLFKSPDGVKFRRQYSIDPYVLDFYCAEAKVAIEIDGIVHDMGDNPQRDEERDDLLLEFGIEVLRVAAVDVLKSPDEVADAIIVRYCKRS